ncbi:MAG: RluA family pseudouridine synthase [Deltaproteobacteria bacterium]|nr:RluA family pseudouridine synthase [Deltaproteobacteria bacterium]
MNPFAPSWTVPSSSRPIRLDAFVRLCLPHLSLREAQRAVGEGAFRINDRIGKKGDRLFPGDVLTLATPGVERSAHDREEKFPVPSAGEAPESYEPDSVPKGLLTPYPLPDSDLRIPILYEDESLLALDKPAGMAVHGFSGRATQTLANFVAAIRPSLRTVGKSRWEPGLVHRLDRDTSGIVLLAKHQDDFDKLRAQFNGGFVKKKYWALVQGRTKQAGVISYPLAHDPRDRRKMIAVRAEVCGPHGSKTRSWKASTRFHKVGSSGGFSLVAIEMETGVTHQIRAHMAAIGHPVVGDPLYSNRSEEPFGLKRQFLHAFYLALAHPRSGEALVITSELPEDLRRVLRQLGLRV